MTRALVIDDEPPIRLLCRVNLEADGIDVIEALDGPSGVAVARATQIRRRTASWKANRAQRATSSGARYSIRSAIPTSSR
jgi:DNA-binding response OmpR family regulator